MRFGNFGNSQSNGFLSSSLQGSLASHLAQSHLKPSVNNFARAKIRFAKDDVIGHCS